MGKRSEQVAEWVPVVKYEVFFFSVVLAIAGMLILSLPSFKIETIGEEGSALDTITYFVDPLFAHLLGIGAVFVLMWTATTHMYQKKRTRLAICVGVPLAAFLMIHGFTEVVLKPSFDYDRPAQHLESPWLSAMLKVDEPREDNSCPSGFVVRQLFLLMIGLVFYRGFQANRASQDKPGRIEGSTLIGLGTGVIFVAFSRVYRGFHTMYDIAISISVSCYVFWLIYYLIGVFPKRVPTNMTSGIVAASCIFVPAFLYYSQDAYWWAIIGIGVLCLIGFTRIIPGGEVNGDLT